LWNKRLEGSWFRPVNGTVEPTTLKCLGMMLRSPRRGSSTNIVNIYNAYTIINYITNFKSVLAGNNLYGYDMAKYMPYGGSSGTRGFGSLSIAVGR